MSEDVNVDDLVRPQPDDAMTNHAEQHSVITDLIVARDKLQQEIAARVEAGETVQQQILASHPEYLKKSGTQTLDEGRWMLKHPKTDGSGNFSYIEIDNDEMGLYHVKYPENGVHAANMQYVDDEVSRVETEVGNKSDSTHDHNSSYATKDHEHPNTMKTGTSTNPSLARGELYLNTNNKVVYVGY